MVKRNPLYSTKAWRDLRVRILDRDGHQCQIRLPGCEGTATQVDHITATSVDADLALTPSNLRAACKACNLYLGGKLGSSRRTYASARTTTARADGFASW